MLFTKKEILDEIRRTAEENGGIPLGMDRFKKETGIGPFDVSRYWPRFGDAISEAGLTRNERWTRYSDDLLIEKSIEKIRKYGRYPTLNELFVEFNQGDDFPFHIFKKRSQPYMVKKILEYCHSRNGYEDVIQACEPILKKLNSKDDLYSDTKKTEKIGEVYLFKSGKYYKIGKTNDTVRRGKELRIQLPENLKLIHSIKTDDTSGIETYWHKRFEGKRMNGEWFDLSAADIKSFKSWRRIA
ncbi:MAG: GIY-YIG nuclease family protein [Patescibacteria group bacterium]|jgi:hypothetical protein